jgi:uncharacterized membrane protein HdeD (DUF308 family)
MKPIWYFVGLILLIMGGIIFLSGLYQLANPPQNQVVLGENHPDIWWGALMVIVGIIYVVKNRKVKIE